MKPRSVIHPNITSNDFPDVPDRVVLPYNQEIDTGDLMTQNHTSPRACGVVPTLLACNGIAVPDEFDGEPIPALADVNQHVASV